MAGGPDALLKRAAELISDGDYRRATQLVDYAMEAAPGDESVQEVAAELYEERATTGEPDVGDPLSVCGHLRQGGATVPIDSP